MSNETTVRLLYAVVKVAVLMAPSPLQRSLPSFCSDPRTIHSTVASDRGAGVFFGPDVTERFCALNGVSLVVRSHECVPEGAQMIAVGEVVKALSWRSVFASVIIL